MIINKQVAVDHWLPVISSEEYLSNLSFDELLSLCSELSNDKFYSDIKQMLLNKIEKLAHLLDVKEISKNEFNYLLKEINFTHSDALEFLNELNIEIDI